MNAPMSLEALSIPAVSNHAVEVRGLTKRFSGPHGDVVVLDNVTLDLQTAERLVLLGPSGCGKTTLLRCIAGLEMPDQGEIVIAGRVVFCAKRGIFVPPEHRGISMVFQSYALWPHMTAAENIAYPLQNRGVAKAEVDRRVEEILLMVGCEALGRRYPSQLSGGQQQRIALARAVVGSDPLVLFDEPLSNVDAKVRESLRVELIAMQKRLGFAAVYVTHDQTEATAVAHRMAVMQTGKFAQVGSPKDIYENPVSSYVAEFTGTSNRLAGEVAELAAGRTGVKTALGMLVSTSSGTFVLGQKVDVLLRPEYIQLLRREQSSGNSWLTRVESRMFLGAHTEYALSGPEGYMLARDTDGEVFDEEADVWAAIQPRHVKIFPEKSA